METETKQTTNVLLTLPESLNEKLQRQAKMENRSRHAQIIFILEKYFIEQLKAKGAKK